MRNFRAISKVDYTNLCKSSFCSLYSRLFWSLRVKAVKFLHLRKPAKFTVSGFLKLPHWIINSCKDSARKNVSYSGIKFNIQTLLQTVAQFSYMVVLVFFFPLVLTLRISLGSHTGRWMKHLIFSMIQIR